MLRLAKVRPGREGYYLESTLAGGGKSPYVEPDGRWAGSQSAELGLSGGVVDAGGLRSILQGIDPLTGRPLDAAHRRVSVAAFDCTFAAPKSVSVLHALAPAEVVDAVRAAHERAVEGALQFLERNAAFVRRDRTPRRSNGFAAAAFLHRTSRAPDPHLHTHLLLANLGSADGRWTAIDSRPLFAHVGVAGSLYRAGLRHELSTSLGVSWQDRVDGFADLVGLPAVALRGFSRRAAEIAADLERTGLTGRQAARVAAARTRPAKDLSVDYRTLVEAWRERAFEFGISRSVVRDVAHRLDRAVEDSRQSEVARSVVSATGAIERQFDRRELLRATAGRLDSGAPAATIEAAVDVHLASSAVVRCGESALQLGSGGCRFPSGIAEQRFATLETVDLTRRLAELLECVPELPGESEAGTATRYESIRALVVEAAKAGRQVSALAPNRVLSAHLEATIGIEATSWREVSSVDNGALVVIADPARGPLRATVELLSDASDRRLTVVVVPRPEVAESQSSGLDEARAVGRIDRQVVLGVKTSVVPDLASAAGEIRRLTQQTRSDGAATYVVTADRRCVGPDCATILLAPGDVARVARADPSARFVALGNARLLGPALSRIPDAHRAHVVVAPVGDRPNRQGWRLALAEPASVRATLGRYPESTRERLRWTERASEINRDRDFVRVPSMERIRVIGIARGPAAERALA